MLPRVASAYALRDFGVESLEFTRKILPYGVNMAIRFREQSEYLYDTNLGPRPGSALRGEETEVLWRMLEDGVKGRWVPGAIVRHYIPPKRQTVRFLRSYYRSYGQYQYTQIENGEIPNPLGNFRILCKTAVASELTYCYRRLVHEPKIWVIALVNSSIAWGQLLRSLKA